MPTGELEVDDLDGALRIVDTFEPPPLSWRARVRLGAALVRACGVVVPPKPPASELRLRGERHTVARRPTGGSPPLRRRQRLLRPVPRRVDDIQLRVLVGRGADARGGAGGKARARLQEAAAERGRARPRRRLRLGQLRDPCRGAARRQGAGHHAVGATGPAGPAAGSCRRAVGPGRDPGRRLPRAEGEPYDAIASIGMVEHVGEERIDLYAQRLVGTAAARRAALQSRDRQAPGLRRPRRGRVLGAVRVPRRRAAAALTRGPARSSEPGS